MSPEQAQTVAEIRRVHSLRSNWRGEQTLSTQRIGLLLQIVDSQAAEIERLEQFARNYET